MRAFFLFFLIISITFISQGQSKKSKPKRDHRLTVVEITGFDKSKTIGYLHNFTDSTVFLLRPDSTMLNTVLSAVSYQDIFDIRYYQHGSFGEGFFNALGPSTLFFGALALPIIDYWGALVFISSPIVTIPLSSLIGFIDLTRKSKSNYRVNGELKKFQIQANREINKAYITATTISFTKTGRDWYDSFQQGNNYYPELDYRPRIHLSFSAVPIIQRPRPTNRSAILDKFREQNPLNEYITSSTMSVSFSISDRWEVGAMTFLGQGRSKSWTLTEGDFFYSYQFSVYHQYNALFGMFHLLPYVPNRQPFQFSLGGGLALNEGEYQSSYEGRYNNSEFLSWENSYNRLPSIAPFLQARSEAFFTEGFSMHISCEYVPMKSKELESIRLTAPFIEDPINQQFNISSLTFSAGIRFHY